ncbi:hypothetical protein FQN54_000061 [Arachnomyces sp. PD_36]|nr:hypothetical protein FQN54_000061 [Arachnomyces sp. PD_36]
MPAEQRQQPEPEDANQASTQLAATADELENESNLTRPPREPSGIEPRVASSWDPNRHGHRLKRQRAPSEFGLDASAKNNRPEYDPTLLGTNSKN